MVARFNPGMLLVVCAYALHAWIVPVVATAQEAVMSTAAASISSGTVASRVNVNEVKPAPATDGSLSLPSLSVIDDGTGPQVTSLVLQLPHVDLGGLSLVPGLGDQRLPAVFRGSALAGPALASPVRGLTLTTTGSSPLSLSFGQGPVPAPGRPPTSPAFAAAAVRYTPNSRFSLTPQILFPGGSPDAQRSIGTTMQATVVGNLALVTDVGIGGTTNTTWEPLASARLVGQWPRAGIQTVVLRGAAAPATATNAVLVAQDREAAQATVQPVQGFTVTALASLSRPSSRPDVDDTALGSLRVAYDGFHGGQLAAVRQREETASREAESSSLEWHQRGLSGMTVRYVRRSTSDSMLTSSYQSASRVELELPVLAPRCAGCMELHAALTAGSMSPTDSGMHSKVGGRVPLVDSAVLMGETELGLTGADQQLLRALSLTTEVPVVPATRLQFSYTYSTDPLFPLRQVFQARIVRRVTLGW